MTTEALRLWRDDTRLHTPEVMALFASLACPSIAEMNGEYGARVLPQPNAAMNWLAQHAISNPIFPGTWLCKGFTPISNSEGRGYNGFHFRGRDIRRFPMQTLIAPSRFDGKPAYQLIYAAYDSLFGRIHMVDEVRRAADGHYLGIGTCGFSQRQRLVPLPFTLVGPVAPFDMSVPPQWKRRAS